MPAAATFVLGLAILVVGAELVVRGTTKLAMTVGISPLILGLTVVSIGTSAPELAVGITASLEGAPAIAVANIAGTNVLNLLFILGLAALLRPVPLHLRILKLELPTIVAAAALMTLLAWDDGVLTTSDGLVLLLGAIGYTVLLVRESRREGRQAREQYAEAFEETPVPTERVGRLRLGYGLLLVVALALTIYGADLMVDGAVELARSWRISEALIGLTIVAIGTSAPELATTLVATVRNERDVAVGNLIGSSIYNILFILGVTCVVLPGDLPVDADLLTFDIPLMAGVAVLCVPVFVSGRSISRIEGAIFVSIYLAYLAYLIAVRATF
jgi:cation:H+ antiporter